MKLVQEIKAHSPKWIKTKGRKYEQFFWQDGYGAFSVCEKDIDKIISYIKNQRQHHQNTNYKDELTGILEKKHKIEYNEKYLWD